MGRNSGMTTKQLAPVVDGGLASIKQAGEYLSVSRTTVYQLMDSGKLAWTKIGKCRRIPWAALKELAAKELVVA